MLCLSPVRVCRTVHAGFLMRLSEDLPGVYYRRPQVIRLDCDEIMSIYVATSSREPPMLDEIALHE